MPKTDAADNSRNYRVPLYHVISAIISICILLFYYAALIKKNFQKFVQSLAI